MKFVTGLLLLSLYMISESDGKPFGGVQMIIKQAGINTASEYLQDHFAYVLRRQVFNEQKILKKTIVINDIHIIKTSGMYTELTIEGHNTLRLNAGFADFFVQANVTFFRYDGVLRSPYTVLNFKDAQISTNILIGQGNDGKDVDLSDCFINIDGLQLVNSSAESKKLLKSYIIVAKQQIHGMLTSMCTELENKTRKKYWDLLDFEGDFIVRGDGPIDLTMDYKLNNITATQDKIILKMALGFEGTELPDYGSHDVQFPDPVELGHENSKEVEMWFNSDLMNLLMRKALEVEKIIPRSLTVFKTDRHDFKITEGQIPDTFIDTTKYGIALRLSSDMTILQARTGTNEYCVDIRVSLNAILPFSILINDTRTEFHPNPDRFHVNLTVTAEDVAYTDCGPTNPRKDTTKFEKKVLHELLKEFEINYNHRLAFIKLMRDRYIGTQDTSIETLQDCAIITANLAHLPDKRQEGTIVTEHKLYHHRVIQYTYTDKSTETFIDHKLKQLGSDTNTSSIMIRDICIHLISLTFVLLIL